MGAGEDRAMLVAICAGVAIAVGIGFSYFLVVYTVESMTTHRGATPWQLVWEDFTAEPK